MSTEVMAAGAERAPRCAPPRQPARLALLGCGKVGSELVRLLEQDPRAAARVDRALVRQARTPRSDLDVRFTTSADAVLADSPDLVVELLGGCEPARALVLAALTRGLPVVTANKSLLARHGRDLREAARRSGVPLQYEAAVIAGVPFLGTFARRPGAAQARGFTGIVNGTSNFVLTRLPAGREVVEALREAERLGYAEPDPRNDLEGTDALEKLIVLLQHFAGLDPRLESIETRGITSVSPFHARLAEELGGALKPVVAASWDDGLEAFAAPAFVPERHPLYHVTDVENALLLDTRQGRLLFQGPGAGPRVTASTVLDDIHEIVEGAAGPPTRDLSVANARAPLTGWLIALEGPRLPAPLELAEYLAAHDLYIQRTTLRHSQDGRERQAYLTWPAERACLERALPALERATALTSFAVRALEGIR